MFSTNSQPGVVCSVLKFCLPLQAAGPQITRGRPPAGLMPLLVFAATAWSLRRMTCCPSDVSITGPSTWLFNFYFMESICTGINDFPCKFFNEDLYPLGFKSHYQILPL